MARQRLHGLLWWIDRWRQSSAYRQMDLEQQAAYRNLLDEAWLSGGVLPNDDRILARACGDALAWPRVRDAVLGHFELQADGWHNPTLQEVRAKMEATSAIRSTVGAKGAAMRWRRG